MLHPRDALYVVKARHSELRREAELDWLLRQSRHGRLRRAAVRLWCHLPLLQHRPIRRQQSWHCTPSSFEYWFRTRPSEQMASSSCWSVALPRTVRKAR